MELKNDKEIKNIEDYLLTTLAICGEVKALGIGRNMPFTETYILRHLSEMVQDGLIRKYEYDDGKFYRLSKKGIEQIEKDTPDLMSRLDLLIGPKGERYKGTKEKRKRRRHSFEVASLSLKENMTVDLISLSPARAEWQEVSDMDFAGIISRVNPEEKTFLTKRVLRGMDDALEAHPRNHMFRTIGVFFSGKNIFPAYYIENPGERFWGDVEISFLNLLTKAVMDNYNAPAERYSGIFYTGRERVIRDYLFPEKRVYRFSPNKVYGIYYMIPINKSAGATTSLILTDKWRERTNALLIESEGRIGDGTSSEGLPVYNFLGNNLSYMKRNALPLQKSKGVLIVHDWQVEIAKRMFGPGHELRVVEDEMLREILKDIK